MIKENINFKMNQPLKKAVSLTILSLCLLVAGVKAQNVEQITLQQAIDRTLTNNLQIKQAEFSASITEESLKQSRYELLPSLSSGFSANKRFGLYFDQTSGGLTNQSTNTASGNLSSSVTLFNGLALKNQILQNKSFLAADKSNVEKIKNDLTLSVITTFLAIINNQDLIKASKDQLGLSKQQLGVSQKRFDVGDNTQVDLSQAKAQVAINELSLTNAQNAYELSILDLKQLMNMDPQQEIEVVVPAIDDPAQIENKYTGYDVYAKAMLNYPDIKLATNNTEGFKYGVKVAKGNLYPSLSFGAQIFDSYSSNARDFITGGTLSFADQINQNFGQAIGFNLSIPIFGNYRSRSSYNVAKIRYENAKATEQLAKNNLNKIVSQAVQDLKAAIKSYASTKSAFESSKDAFNAIQQRYDVGLVNIIELNTAQTNYNKAEFDFIQAKYNVIFRSKVIDFYLGNPLTL